LLIQLWKLIFIASDRGHLLEGVSKSGSNPWGNYVGTWDLPRRLPSNHATNEISRSVKGINNLQEEKQKAEEKILSANLKKGNRVNSGDIVSAENRSSLPTNENTVIFILSFL